MPKNPNIKKVLVLGSGPIVIGQAAEFDYAGTQACRALKEEGVEVVLVNSNPATIMTDKDIADHVYIEPLNIASVTQVIQIERPDSILPTLGGQTGLNLAMNLHEQGILEEYNVRLLGTSPESIRKAEDRQGFKDAMEELGQPCVTSDVVESVEDAVDFANSIGYPVIVRPAYTLGGTGGGIAYDEPSLREIADRGIHMSRVGQVLIERSIAGWKEIEFEVMRDSAGNVIQICSMENIDPVGVHTGDSIVVAPTQTLANKEYQMLRTASLDIISALRIEGGCNVQLALNPDSYEYAVIEVNPRVSRSSALASKATGYPIAKVAAKIALGYTLDEIPNAVTGKTTACFEPTLDYCVLKIPRLPFDKFTTASRTLGTQMKATGEVMAIGNSFEGALMKAIRSLELPVKSLRLDGLDELYTEEIEERLANVDDQRLFVVAEALRRGFSPEKINKITQMDIWFLDRFQNIVDWRTGWSGAIWIGTLCIWPRRWASPTPGSRPSRERPPLRSRPCGGSWALSHPSRWWIPAPPSSRRRPLTTIPPMTRRTRRRSPMSGGTHRSARRFEPLKPMAMRRTRKRKKCWCWAPAPSVSDRALSSTTAPFTLYGPSAAWVMRPSSSIITRKPSPLTSMWRTSSILSR